MEERKKDKKTFKEIAEKSSNPVVQKFATEAIKKDFEGDEVAQKMIQLTQIMSGMRGQADIDENTVKEIVRDTIETDKISLDNLDSVVRGLIENKPTQVKMTITTSTGTVQKSLTISPEVERPLMQKILSDVLARNNVYLYGGAGTGKSFSAKVISELLGWDLIEINCNQFTSPLELIGGQTIDGYQEGKVIRAWANLDENGKETNKGCVLLLDELPKIDPNTAGILNSALARVAEYTDKVDSDGNPIAESIENGRGQKFERKKVFIMATGNALLNMKDPEYEANFKQDLSLQDRFVGSTYEVFVDVGFEWKHILNEKWAFLCIYLNKLRNAIFEEGFQSKAFVSVRIMQSVQKTYNVYRQIKSKGSKKSFKVDTNPDISYTPAPYDSVLETVGAKNVKTVQDSLDEFFSLFNDTQRETLKNVTDYKGFLSIVKEKDGVPMDELNTPAELQEMEDIIKEAKAKHKY